MGRSSFFRNTVVSFLGVTLLAIWLAWPQKQLDWQGTILPLARQYAGSQQEQQPLQGKIVVITGCTNGIGLALTRAVSQLGATVIGIGRSPTRLAQLQQEIPSLHPVRADLSDLRSVALATKQIVEQHDRIDMLINNAGIHEGFDLFARPPVSQQGYNLVFQVNYLSHFLLTNKLIPVLTNATKPTILQISSSFHWAVDGSDLYLGNNDTKMPVAARPGGSTGYYIFRSQRSYANSKLAQILHARALQRQYPKIRIKSACPAWVSTHIAGKPGESWAHTLLQQAAFPAHGWGMASLLIALLDDPQSGDWYINTKALLLANWLFGGREALPAWFYQTGLRDVTIGFLSSVTLWVQNVFASVGPVLSSPESYNETIQNSLYDWSLLAIKEY